jgi:hypothetical protein
MAALVLSTNDLSTFLGGQQLDINRAQMMLDGALALCSTIVTPVPDTAKLLVLSVAARPFANPQGVTAETVGPFNVQRPGGVYLTRAERSTLRTLAGRGGAFSVDPTPSTAGQGLQPWDTNTTWLEGVPVADNYSGGYQ